MMPTTMPQLTETNDINKIRERVSQLVSKRIPVDFYSLLPGERIRLESWNETTFEVIAKWPNAVELSYRWRDGNQMVDRSMYVFQEEYANYKPYYVQIAINVLKPSMTE